MTPYIITPTSGAVCHCKAKAGLKHSPRDQFPRAWHHSKRRPRWAGVKGSTHNGHRDPKYSSALRLHIVGEDTEALSEGATCAWRAADEAVGCTRTFLTMRWSFRRLFCQGHPVPGLRVNPIS
ncbi:uncharacterized protein TNCV_4851321 [Trichonephila clavipes]|nr:uncharacterized protein TNCV_4851321 [Trichonephila clavipes]